MQNILNKEFIFNSKTININGHFVLVIPQEISDQMPSKSMMIVKARLNNAAYTLPLQPDGRAGHWIDLPVELKAATKVSFALTEDWPEPEMPQEFLNNLENNPEARQIFYETTVKARWEWYRWLTSTNNQSTYLKRVNVAIDKLAKGMRRTCCFNLGSCTIADVAKNGKLAL